MLICIHHFMLFLCSILLRSLHSAEICNILYDRQLQHLFEFKCMRSWYQSPFFCSYSTRFPLTHSPCANICYHFSPAMSFWLRQSAMRGRSHLNGKQKRRKWVIKLKVSESVCRILMTMACARRIIFEFQLLLFSSEMQVFCEDRRFCPVCQTF